MAAYLPWVVTVQAGNSSADERSRFERAIERHVAGHEWIVLSTCHRVEVYGFGAMPDVVTHPCCRIETGGAAVQHLVRVAAGLESTIVGEDEILHQVRDALKQARSSRLLDGRLQRLFETAIAAGRRARAGRTAPGGNLAQKAMAWLEQRATLQGRTVLVVGAGRMGSSLAHAARSAGADLTIASRDAGKADRLARAYGGRGIDLVAAAELAPRSAAVAVALAGPWHEFQPALGQLPPIADISAPAAIPTDLRTRLSGDFLCIDDLYTRSDPVPGGYVSEAVRVVATKTDEYMRWLAVAKAS
ncbi:MAG: NAD(P)-binding domain-containing protein [Candidatus Dormibacteraceae bacterium]